MNKFNLMLFCSLLLFTGFTCTKEDEDCHTRIPFTNKKEYAIYVDCGFEYPDTTGFKLNPDPTKDPYYTKVSANGENEYTMYLRGCLESDFKNSIPSDTIMIYVFDGRALESTSWEEIKATNKVLQRYDLSLQDLQQLDFNLTYPPSGEMRYMRMYPPYKEE